MSSSYTKADEIAACLKRHRASIELEHGRGEVAKGLRHERWTEHLEIAFQLAAKAHDKIVQALAADSKRESALKAAESGANHCSQAYARSMAVAAEIAVAECELTDAGEWLKYVNDAAKAESAPEDRVVKFFDQQRDKYQNRVDTAKARLKLLRQEQDQLRNSLPGLQREHERLISAVAA